jgi:crotonobetainyl-CoA:carnitine CoA-transferase CaiB-like acyl-CoA transferase
MAAVMLSINERVHADLSDTELGAELPILGATDCAFFVGPDGNTFVSPMSLVGSTSFPLYLAAMRRADLARDPRFATPADRARNLKELHDIVQRWIWTFDDVASLDAQLDEAKIATGRIRDIRELAASDWARQWGATREVPDGAGGEITVPGRPWHFSGGVADTGAGDEPRRLAAGRGRHNEEVLREHGYSEEDIASLTKRGVLVYSPRGDL